MSFFLRDVYISGKFIRFSQSDEKTKRNDQLATAILKDKIKPNRLMVEQSPKDDNSVVALSQVIHLLTIVSLMQLF